MSAVPDRNVRYWALDRLVNFFERRKKFANAQHVLTTLRAEYGSGMLRSKRFGAPSKKESITVTIPAPTF